MALYAAIGAEFKSSILKEFDTLLDERIRAVIALTLKQVAHDYELDYKELKSRYCSKESLDEYVPSAKHSAPFPGQTQIVTVDLEAEAEVKPSKAKIPSAVMALSKMKKCDLVRECEERGLDSEGTVSQLKERVKDARSSEHPEPVKDKKKSVPKKEPAPKKKPAPKKEKKSAVKEPVAPPPPVALEEEKDDEDEPTDTEEEDEDICQRADDEEFEEDEDNGSSMHDKLRKLLAEANEEEEEEDYDEDDE
jgi:hypothetical protein